MSQASHPAELRQPRLRTPCIAGGGEKIVRSLTDECARVRPNILDAILVKPILHFAQGVPMLFGMLILIPQPCLPPRRLVVPFTQHRIERNPSIPGYPGAETSQPERAARECVVEADDDDPPLPRQRADAAKTCAWALRAVQAHA